MDALDDPITLSEFKEQKGMPSRTSTKERYTAKRNSEKQMFEDFAKVSIPLGPNCTEREKTIQYLRYTPPYPLHEQIVDHFKDRGVSPGGYKLPALGEQPKIVHRIPRRNSLLPMRRQTWQPGHDDASDAYASDSENPSMARRNSSAGFSKLASMTWHDSFLSSSRKGSKESVISSVSVSRNGSKERSPIDIEADTSSGALTTYGGFFGEKKGSPGRKGSKDSQVSFASTLMTSASDSALPPLKAKEPKGNPWDAENRRPSKNFKEQQMKDRLLTRNHGVLERKEVVIVFDIYQSLDETISISHAAHSQATQSTSGRRALGYLQTINARKLRSGIDARKSTSVLPFKEFLNQIWPLLSCEETPVLWSWLKQREMETYAKLRAAGAPLPRSLFKGQ